MRVALPVFALLTYALTASAHSLILSVTGANGVTSSGFGVVKSTPRDGKSLVRRSTVVYEKGIAHRIDNTARYDPNKPE
jgi:hypothetical protein